MLSLDNVEAAQQTQASGSRADALNTAVPPASPPCSCEPKALLLECTPTATALHVLRFYLMFLK